MKAKLMLAGAVALGLFVWWHVAPVSLVATGLLLGGFEVCVVASAVCDWREAKLVVVGWRQAWAVAHATVFIRAARRARHWVREVRLRRARRQMVEALSLGTGEQSAPERGYVVLDPTAPFTGRVIDPHAHDGAERRWSA